jgi:enoyl-CoA hydratase/carnithine racemase
MLEIADHDTIGEIRLARPPVNALNPELVKRLTESLLDAVKKFDAVVISGQEGMFCAGLDVVELQSFDRQAMTNFWTRFFSLLESIACSPVPIASAITGHAPAGGAILNLMTDYRVMSRGNYRVGLNETRVGLVVCALLQDAMARLVGKRTAEKMLVAGTLIGPQKALEIGLVDALEDGCESTVLHAIEWCKEVLALPRHAMLGNRAVARAHFKLAFNDYRDESVWVMVDGWFADETQIALDALVRQLKSKK